MQKRCFLCTLCTLSVLLSQLLKLNYLNLLFKFNIKYYGFFVQTVYRLHSGLLSQFGREFAFCDYSPDDEHLKMLAFHIPATYSIFWPSEFMKKPKARHSHQQMCLATVSDRTNRFTSHPIE